MLKIKKTVLPSPEQWEIIIEGMRNPMNSWDKMDSFECLADCCDCGNYYDCTNKGTWDYNIGKNDLKLMTQLAKGGPVHAKYRRMIPVFLTINAPLYWWKEFDTYKVGTVANSCSTMHKIHSKEFTMNDFSVERIEGMEAKRAMQSVVNALNHARDNFLTATDKLKRTDLTEAERKHTTAQRKYFFDTMIQLLPTSYNQKRTVMLNYEVLVNIYHSRKNHKLDEWHIFCDWIRQLPYSELITGGE